MRQRSTQHRRSAERAQCQHCSERCCRTIQSGVPSRRTSLRNSCFSVLHDHRAVRIYGSYVLINGNDTSFYRHLIQDFGIIDQDAKDKWTAYKFMRNVYDTFVPIHLEKICTVVDQLPDPEVFLVEPLSQQSNAESFEQDDSQSALSYLQKSASRLPSSQTTKPVFKKPKGKGVK